MSTPADTASSIEWRFFFVGLILLAAALAMAFQAFWIGTLTPDQRFILLWVLPLASGFGAGAFVGSLSARVRRPVAGLLVTATGGFGVWLLSYFLIQVPSDKHHPAASLTPSEVLVRDLKKQIVEELWGHYQAAEKFPSSANRVREEAPKYGARLLGVGDADLSPGYRLAKYHYAAYAYTLAASVAGTTREERLQNANTAIPLATRTLQLINQARTDESSGSGTARAIVDWIDKDRLPERTLYVLAVSRAIEARFGGPNSLTDARRALAEIPKAYLDEFSPRSNPHLRWVIEHSGEGDRP